MAGFFTPSVVASTQDDVKFVRQELIDVMPRYRDIRHCIEETIKSQGIVYLPVPNSTDTSAENVARYAAYLERAVFYGVTGRTLSGLVAQMFSRDPEIVVPDRLKSLVSDASGSNVSLEQMSKDAADDAMSYGRAGLYTDFPKRDGAITTLRDITEGKIQPTLTLYGPESIINWRERFIGSKRYLCLVVLAEVMDVEGVFSVTQAMRYRVLRLREYDSKHVYTVEVWSEDVDGVMAVVEPEFSPTDSAGKYFDEIPFDFIGSLNNDSSIDDQPLYGLAQLNIAHYRNSADYEESCFITGQPTLWLSGLDDDWITDVFKGEPILLGSRRAIPLPVGAQAGLLQTAPNIMPAEAMKHKENQMVALGAKLVEQRQVRRTAFETGQSNAAETSVLANVSKNVSSAFTAALKRACLFVGAKADEAHFRLNTDFAITSMPAEERAALIADWQSGGLAWEEYRTLLRRSGLTTLDDAEAKASIEADEAKKQADEIALAAATKPAPTSNLKAA